MIASAGAEAIVSGARGMPSHLGVVGFFLQKATSALGLVIFLTWLIALLLAPCIAPYDPVMQEITDRLQPPSATHLLGTDELGRDVLSRVLYGGRVSVPSGFAVVLVSGLIGSVLGSIAGYRGGWLDELVMRVTDLFFAFPPMILALAFGAALGPQLDRSIAAICIVWWPQYARIARGMVLSIREREFVLAARTLGASDGRILARAVFPNAMTPILVVGALDIGNAIVTVAIFSFLGLGVQPPTPEWGAMIARGASLVDKWWVSMFPGLAMTSMVIACNLLGDASRDYLDPRLRHESRARTV
jgi:peptide/nickel transport system permease protein